ARPRITPPRHAGRGLLSRWHVVVTEVLPFHLDWTNAPALPPAFLFFAAALLLALLRGRPLTQRVVLLATPLIGLVNLCTLDIGSTWPSQMLDLELVQLRVDRLRLLFGLLFHIGAFIGVIYSLT